MLRTNPGTSGLIWLQLALKIRPHDGTGKFSMNLYLYRAIRAFFWRYTVLRCFLRTDLRAEFHTTPLCESAIKRALCTELNSEGDGSWGVTLISGHLCTFSTEHVWSVISDCDQSSTFTLTLHGGSLLPSWWNHLNFSSVKDSANVSLTNFNERKKRVG